MSTQKRKTLVYKKATFLKPVGATLQTLLTNALQGHQTVLSRREDPQADGSYFRLINYFGNHGLNGAGGNLLAGELFSYEPAAIASGVLIDPSLNRLDVNAILPQKKGQEFLDGTVYFGILDNHVVLLQSTSLKAIDLEHHLNWLLRQAGSGTIFEPEDYVGLSDQEPKRKKSVFKDVKGVKISGPVKFEAGKPDENAKLKEKSATLRPTGNVWEAIKTFFGPGVPLPKELDAEEILNSGQLTASLYVHWTAKHSESGSDLLANVGYNMRHVDDELDYSVITRSGEIKKDEFKLKQPIGIAWRPETGQPAFDDLFPKMLQWLDTLIKDDKVDP